jgi:hypothetical protein
MLQGPVVLPGGEDARAAHVVTSADKTKTVG